MNSEARRRRVISEAIGSDGTAGAGAANVHSAAHCDRGRMIAALAESVGHDQDRASASQSRHSGWPLMLAAAAILMVTFGVRQSIGLYVSPLNTATGLGIANISLAFTVGQFVWGASQPRAK
jgi:hypothetical protein